MKLLYMGKTKNVYKLSDDTYLLKFKDDATGADGVFDPGANSVGLSIVGLGQAGLRLTEYFFRHINDAGIPTHFISADIDKSEMTVRSAMVFGAGLEVICRYRAVGSFLRRYGMYAADGQELDAFVEVTLKDDERGDPPISRDTLSMLNILTPGEYSKIRSLTRGVSALIRDILASKGLELYDIKLEFGRTKSGIVLIDELSGGNMRVFKDGSVVDPLDLVRLVLG